MASDHKVQRKSKQILFGSKEAMASPTENFCLLKSVLADDSVK
jgi:hypothetical protein